MRTPTMRMITMSVCAVVLAAGCSSSAKTTSTETTVTSAPSTTSGAPAPTTPAPSTPAPDPNLVPNQIPFNVGERMGLPNGWLVELARVHRPFTPSGLPAAPTGGQYVAVDVTMQYNGTGTKTAKSSTLFTIVDSAGQSHQLVAPPGSPNGVDGKFSAGTSRSGQLIFEVPVGKTLRMAFDGPEIGTQRSIFQVDPPKAPSQE